MLGMGTNRSVMLALALVVNVASAEGVGQQRCGAASGNKIAFSEIRSVVDTRQLLLDRVSK